MILSITPNMESSINTLLAVHPSLQTPYFWYGLSYKILWNEDRDAEEKYYSKLTCMTINHKT